MSKQKYRTETDVITEILQIMMDVGREGAIISSITRRANLSHYTAIEKCQKLTDLGLIDSSLNDKTKIFTITEKGIQSFQQMQKSLEMMQYIKIKK